MIDPDKALMPQVWNMNHEEYLKVINSPHWLFVNSPRMFESDLIEPLSHNKWYHIFFLPLILLMYWFSHTDFESGGKFSYLFFPFGVFAFSLT